MIFWSVEGIKFSGTTAVEEKGQVGNFVFGIAENFEVDRVQVGALLGLKRYGNFVSHAISDLLPEIEFSTNRRCGVNSRYQAQ